MSKFVVLSQEVSFNDGNSIIYLNAPGQPQKGSTLLPAANVIAGMSIGINGAVGHIRAIPLQAGKHLLVFSMAWTVAQATAGNIMNASIQVDQQSGAYYTIANWSLLGLVGERYSPPVFNAVGLSECFQDVALKIMSIP